MKSLPQYVWLLRISVVMFCFTLCSCAEHSLTNINIKKTNDALLETQTQKKPAVEKKIEQPKNSQQNDNGPIPMSMFMSPPAKNVIKSSNKWFPRVQGWAKIYREIAKQEQDVRNYSLSAKYSNIGLLWANRSLEIKDLPNEKAIIKIELWLSKIKIPNLSDEPTYFSGHDAYQKVSETQKIMDSLQQRFCLVSEGVQFIPALAYLELANDLMNQKKYAKASTKIQNALGSIENIENEKKSCENSN